MELFSPQSDDTIASSDADLEEIFEEIDDFEIYFLDTPKENRKYYLGIHNLLKTKHGIQLMLGTCVSLPTFYNYSYHIILEYLKACNIMRHLRQPTPAFQHHIEILQVVIREKQISPSVKITIYHVVLKTVWLRIFQRCWRKYYTEKMRVMHARKSPHVQRHFELWGRYPPQIRDSVPIFSSLVRRCME